MFALPEAKRVRRAELYSPPSSPRSTPDPELTDLFLSKVGAQYETVEPVVGAVALDNDRMAVDGAVEPGQPPEAEAEEEELEFRLFSGEGAVAPVQRIRVHSPPAFQGEPGFVVPHRPLGYYLWDQPEAGKRARMHEFAAAAVTAEEVRRLSRMPWPGCAMPWRVLRLTVTRAPADERGVAEKKERTRVGKKTRIARRKNARALLEKEEMERQARLEKEAHEKEKRARKNREKKHKKRAREKAKKAAGAGTNEAGGTAEGETKEEQSGSDSEMDNDAQ